MAAIRKINVGGIDFDIEGKGGGLAYATSSTSASTSTKTATTADGDFELETGVSVKVLFSNANTASAPTLSIDGSTAKSIKGYDTTNPSSWWKAGDVVEFLYNGTSWIMQPTQGQLTDVMSALADNLGGTDDSFKFATDGSGNYGYVKKVAGADTFFPFKSGDDLKDFLISTPYFSYSEETSTLTYGGRACQRNSSEKVVIFIHSAGVGYRGWGLAGLTENSVKTTATTTYGNSLHTSYTVNGKTVYIAYMSYQFSDLSLELSVSNQSNIKYLGAFDNIKPYLNYLLGVTDFDDATLSPSLFMAVPTATKNITSNGAHDVTNYAIANVSVDQTPSHSSTSPNNTIYVNLNTAASPASHITAVSSLANTGGGSGSSYDGTCAFYSGTASVNKNGNTITITIPQTLRCGNRFGTSSSYYDVDRTVTVVLTI